MPNKNKTKSVKRRARQARRTNNKTNLQKPPTTMVPMKPATYPAVNQFRLPPSLSKLPEKICSLTDPFCEASRGTRWPDGAGFSAIPYKNRIHFTLTAASNGGFMQDFTPWNLPFSSLTYNYSSGAYDSATGYTSITGALNLLTNFSEVRPVSAGICIRNMATVMNTSGYLLISRTPNTPALGNVITPGNTLYPQQYVVPITPGMEICIIHTCVGTLGRSFASLQTSGTNTFTTEWDVLRVEGVGLQAGSLIDVETFYNYELNPLNQAFVSQIAPPTLSNSPALQTLSSKAQKVMSSVAHNGIAMAGKFILDKVRNIVRASPVGMIADAVYNISEID